MKDLIQREALDYHSGGRPGKIAIKPTKPLQTQRDLSLAYSPGVAEPCLEIAEDKSLSFKYTARGNLVAVISNGTAVLGLGNIGPEASKPVMEGKGVLFKRFADIDVFDIEVAETDPDRLIDIIASLEPTFGGINLEDIKAPECFYIEEKLRERMKIPVFHDDQHGTAIITAAAFVNALEIVDKRPADVKCVYSGAGAAAMACAQLFFTLGVQPKNLIMCDSRGVIYQGREGGMNLYKERFAVDTPHRTLRDAMDGADVFVGVSAKGVVDKDMVRSMASHPIVMAMANPDPEIGYHEAKSVRDDIIMATGRSDYPNQVNNVLGFPFIFRGALDAQATTVNDEMKIAAVYALAELAKEDVPDDVKNAYNDQTLQFGPEYIIPKPFDWRALLRVAPAVAKAATDSGVARRPIEDIGAYREHLENILGSERGVIRSLIHKARRNSHAKIVYPEGEHIKIIQAAQTCLEEGIARPILLGSKDKITEIAQTHGLSIEGIELVDPKTDARTEKYVDRYYQKRQRRGVSLLHAEQHMRQTNHFGAMMVAEGDADGLVSGLTRSYPETLKPALQIIGPASSDRRVAGAHLVVFPNSVKIFADTTVNIDPSPQDLCAITLSAAEMARSLDIEPEVALLSFSNFGSNAPSQVTKVTEALQLIRSHSPDLSVEGELHADLAINASERQQLFPFSRLSGEANILVFPDLNSANISYKLLKELSEAEFVGPILIGMGAPVNILEQECSVRSVVNMTAITAVQIQQFQAAKTSGA
jgi:malate dehydrogenase (oxaloacetate-decarboxylating)(NADP+)